jgi:outer membrane protein OmpA-like peptidoglycan-associated protein
MKACQIFFLLSFFYMPAAFGQPHYHYQVSDADKLFNQNRYWGAVNIYQNLLKTDPGNADLNYKTGFCYLNSRSQKFKAIEYLEKAVELSSWKSEPGHLKENDAPLIACKHLGDAYYQAHKFSPAILAYEKFKALLLFYKKQEAATFQGLDSKIELCRFAKEIKESFSSSLGPVPRSVDLSACNYSTVLSADKSTMIYTFKVPVNQIKKSEEEDKLFEESTMPVRKDLYFLKRPDIQMGRVPDGVNIDTISYATTIGASVDGQIVLTYRNEKGDACIYVSRLKKDHWTDPEPLSESVNLKGWENNEYVSADGNHLYFTSSRPGGFGGMDIYRCKKLGTGEWSKAVNLGSVINSQYDEVAPYIQPDDATLYFSSNRVTASSYDIFTSSLSDSSQWTVPANVGYPVNRTENDIFQVTAEPKKIFSPPHHATAVPSARNDSAGGKTTPEKDNFLLTCFDSRKIPLTLLKGDVSDATGKVPDQIRITITDNISEETEGIYYPDHETGHYSLLLPLGRNNNVTYEAPGFLFRSENLQLNYQKDYFAPHQSIVLSPLTAAARTELNNIFFEDNSAALRPSSHPELNRIVSLLQKNPAMRVEISHTIYASKDKKANRKLSQSRAAGIAGYLIEKGVQSESILLKGYRKNPFKAKKTKGVPEAAQKNIADQKTELRIIKL